MAWEFGTGYGMVREEPCVGACSSVHNPFGIMPLRGWRRPFALALLPSERRRGGFRWARAVDPINRRKQLRRVSHPYWRARRRDPGLFACAVSMDSMRGQSGIQMLITAEQEAQQIISRARNMKLARLKQAKDEADQEAAAYRASLEREYQIQISEGTGNSSLNVKRLEEETDIKVQGLRDAASSVSSEVVGLLMEQIRTVKT